MHQRRENDERRGQPGARTKCRRDSGKSQCFRGHSGREKLLDAGEDPIGAIVAWDCHQNRQSVKRHPCGHDGARNQPSAEEQSDLESESECGRRGFGAEDLADSRVERAENRVSVLRAKTEKHVLA
jgi:hypothetical protein